MATHDENGRHNGLIKTTRRDLFRKKTKKKSDVVVAMSRKQNNCVRKGKICNEKRLRITFFIRKHSHFSKIMLGQ